MVNLAIPLAYAQVSILTDLATGTGIDDLINDQPNKKLATDRTAEIREDYLRRNPEHAMTVEDKLELKAARVST